MLDEDKFISACGNNDINTVKKLVREGINIHFSGECGFRWACWNGNIIIVKYLIILCKKTKHTPINIYYEGSYGNCMMDYYPIKYIANLGNCKKN